MTTIGLQTLCDGCDADLGNGGLLNALIVGDHRDGIAVNLHFCRDREDGNGGTITGCAGLVLRPEVLTAYAARNPGVPLFAAPVPPPPQPDPSLPPPDPSDAPADDSSGLAVQLPEGRVEIPPAEPAKQKKASARKSTARKSSRPRKSSRGD